MGDARGARAQLDAALAEYSALLGEAPRPTELTSEFSQALLASSDLHARAGDPVAAEGEAGVAVAELEAMRRDRPDDPRP